MFYSFVLVPLLIVLARILDVSLGTIRVIFISKGLRKLATVLGFFEVLIWLIVASNVITHLTHPIYYIAYALGFALGNYIGITIERRLSVGTLIVRIVTKSNENIQSLIDDLSANDCPSTIVDAVDNNGPVKIIFSVLRKNFIKTFLCILAKYIPDAYYTVEDVRTVSNNTMLDHYHKQCGSYAHNKKWFSRNKLLKPDLKDK